MKAHITDLPLFKNYLKNKNLSESSVVAYAQGAKRFLVSNPDIDEEEYYIDFLIANAYKKRMYNLISSLIHFIKYKHADNKPLRDKLITGIKDLKLRQPEMKKYSDKKPLTEEELNHVIDSLTTQKHRIICYIMYLTGLRIGDVLRIPKEGMIMTTLENDQVLKISLTAKGDRQRVVWIFDLNVANTILDFVATHNYDTGYAFVEPKKWGLTSIYDVQYTNYLLFWKDLKTALKTAGVDMYRFAPHSFRRAYAKRVWLRWHDMDKLQRLMGHANVSTSIRYLRQEGYNVSDSMKELQLG